MQQKENTKLKFFIIHNLDQRRKQVIDKELEKSEIPNEDIIFINNPNKNELTYKIKKKAVQKNTKYGVEKKTIKDGWISVSYKHYLALKHIVENSIDLAFIIEDNVWKINGNLYDRVGEYLEELPDDWDIVFECDQFPFSYSGEPLTTNNNLIHKKSNEITYQESGEILLGGGSRAAQFYFVNLDAAKKLYDNYLPFNHAPDLWMNDLFRKLDINSFWAEPTIIETEKGHRTSTNYKLKDFYPYIKSKFINLIVGL